MLRLQEIEARKNDLGVRLEISIRICWKYIFKLRQWVKEHPFPDRNCEIYFFKQVKCKIMARYIFYQKVYRLHTGYFNGSGLLEKKRLKKILRDIGRFFADNQGYYNYYINNCTHHDEVYFVRGQYDWKICPEPNHFDDTFSTSFDGKLAELMANKLLLEYVDGMLDPTCKVAEAAPINSTGPTGSSTLEWTANMVDLVELGYSLYADGVFNNGKASLKNIMKNLSVMSNVNLKEYSRAFSDIRIRKGNVTNFIDKLKAGIIRYIAKLEQREVRK